MKTSKQQKKDASNYPAIDKIHTCFEYRIDNKYAQCYNYRSHHNHNRTTRQFLTSWP